MSPWTSMFMPERVDSNTFWQLIAKDFVAENRYTLKCVTNPNLQNVYFSNS